MRYFRFSLSVSLLCLVLASSWGYVQHGLTGAVTSLAMTLILGAMEVSLSFDNAIVNASVLKTWNAYWRRLFLTVGILIAVFGMWLIFPLLIVAITSGVGMVAALQMALHDPRAFSQILSGHHDQIAAFGGIFLLLVALNFLFDEDKKLHWLGHAEQKLTALGRVSALPMLVALLSVAVLVSLVDEGRQLPVLQAGLWGTIVYVGVDAISDFLEKEEETDPALGKVILHGGLGGFLYLEILDASFSFDGVIGAFAITHDVVIILLGLGIGALFVRSLTVYLVERGTLQNYVYLEHGAHYAIGMLALILFISIRIEVPELLTGLTGIGFILASLWSSIRHRNNKKGEPHQGSPSG